MKAYHYTKKYNLKKILEKGLRPFNIQWIDDNIPPCLAKPYIYAFLDEKMPEGWVKSGEFNRLLSPPYISGHKVLLSWDILPSDDTLITDELCVFYYSHNLITIEEYWKMKAENLIPLEEYKGDYKNPVLLIPKLIVPSRLKVEEVEQNYFSEEEYITFFDNNVEKQITSNTNYFENYSAGVLIITKDFSEMLLLKRSTDVLEHGVWSFAGGELEKFSSGLEDGAHIIAVHESMKKMGYLPKGRLRKTPYFFYKNKTKFTYKIFLLEIDHSEKEKFRPSLNHEFVGYKWFKVDSLEGVLINPGLRRILNDCVL